MALVAWVLGEIVYAVPAPPVRPVPVVACPRPGLWGSIGIGGGGLREQVSAVDSVEGRGGAFDLTLGWAFRPGLVAALAFMADRADEPRLTLLSAGAVLVWYPRPGGAFHLRGGLVGSQLTVGDDEGRAEDRGLGLVLGAGLETRVWRRWSAGVLLRGVFSRLGDRDDDHGVGAVSLLLTLSRS